MLRCGEIDENTGAYNLKRKIATSRVLEKVGNEPVPELFGPKVEARKRELKGDEKEKKTDTMGIMREVIVAPRDSQSAGSAAQDDRKSSKRIRISERRNNTNR